jgi:hyaluronan synthase
VTAEDLYPRPGKAGILVVQILIVAMLSVAACLKFSNLQYYWYQPVINFYSIAVGVFILSRFLLAALYIAPPDVGYEPSVAVIVAGMNEEDAIGQTINRIYQNGYPDGKLEVVVVNDGSTDDTLAEMLHAQAMHANLVVVDFEDNKGKRHGMAAGALLAQSEALVYVDSDSFLLPDAIHKIVQGLADPTVAAVAGHTDVENAYINLLTRMQDVRYYVSYRVMKAAEHVFGAVSCCPGCFSAYRRTCVESVLDTWLHQRFLGSYATFGDDRSLTNYLLRHYRVLYDCEALATTIVPEKWGHYVRQQARWKRSWSREIFFAGRWFWRKHPLAAMGWYAMSILPLVAPLVMFNALVIAPLLLHKPAFFYLGGISVVTLLWSLYYLEKTGRRDWWSAFAFTMTYVFFFSWQGYYAFATMGRTAWGTRGT